MDCLYVPKKRIYKVVNQMNGNKYLFIGKHSSTNEIINKWNNKVKLSSSENQNLVKVYGKDIISEMDQCEQVFQVYISDNEDIFTLKKNYKLCM